MLVFFDVAAAVVVAVAVVVVVVVVVLRSVCYVVVVCRCSFGVRYLCWVSVLLFRVVEVVDMWLWRLCTGCGVWVVMAGSVWCVCGVRGLCAWCGWTCVVVDVCVLMCV